MAPKEEKDRRMKNGECVKCGRTGQHGKECRTGWKYNPTTATTATTIAKSEPEVKVIEKKSQQPARKKRFITQADGNIKTIAECSDGDNDSSSGND